MNDERPGCRWTASRCSMRATWLSREWIVPDGDPGARISPSSWLGRDASLPKPVRLERFVSGEGLAHRPAIIKRCIDPRSADPLPRGPSGRVVAPYLSKSVRAVLEDRGTSNDPTGNVRSVLTGPGLFLLASGADTNPWPASEPDLVRHGAYGLGTACAQLGQSETAVRYFGVITSMSSLNGSKCLTFHVSSVDAFAFNAAIANSRSYVLPPTAPHVGARRRAFQISRPVQWRAWSAPNWTRVAKARPRASGGAETEVASEPHRLRRWSERRVEAPRRHRRAFRARTACARDAHATG